MNRCDNCGRYAKDEDLEGREDIWMDQWGDLCQEWSIIHKEGRGCMAPLREEAHT